MAIQLRQYQLELISKIKNEIISGKKSVVAVLGCGGGKSVIQGSIAKSATEKNNRVLFLVHRKELCEQIRDTFDRCGVDFNLCSVSMVQTVSRHLSKLETPALILVDECHHILSPTYMNIIQNFPSAVIVGFTATPIRMGSGGLGKAFESMVESVSTQWLIANNYLSPYRYYSIKLADAKGTKISRGDYVAKDLAILMERRAIYGDTVRTYNKIAPGKKAIVYCASIEASEQTAKEFNANGIVAAHLDGETPKEARKATMQAFRNNEIQVLCNVDLFGEGLDVPDCECVILLRPTKSLTLFIQQSMRSMRYMPGKTAIIIDHVANVYEHGFPDDEREWTLEGKQKKKASDKPIRECPICFACMPAGARLCDQCGYSFPVEQKSEMEKVEQELEELKRQPHDHYRKCKTFEDLKRFQQAHKYKFSWVLHKALELKIPIPSGYEIRLNYMSRR